MSKANSQKPNLTPGVKIFIDKLSSQGGKPLYELSYEAARGVLREVQKKCVEKEIADIRDYDLPVGDGGKVRVRIVRPEDAKEELPVIFYIHGGGWVMGDENTHDRLIRELAVKAHAAVVYPVYVPSPEAQYPAQIEMLFATLEFVMQNAKDFKFQPKLAVAGDSVGGNMATVMTMMAKARGFPKIDFQLLLYPVTSAAMNTKSYSDFADGPWLTKKAMEWFWKAYLPEKDKRKDIMVSPLEASKEELMGLPPVLVITVENDVLRDEGEEYAQKLSEAGVKTASLRVNGTIHDFMMLNDLSATEPTKAAIDLAVLYLRQAFDEK